MILSETEKAKIAQIVSDAGAGDIAEHSLKSTGGGFRFELTCGEDLAIKACEALLDAGVQHSTRDNAPEYKLSGTTGGDNVTVTWLLLDMSKPVFSGDLKTT